MPFLVEHTLADYWHACTVDDVAAMLDHLPKRHVNNYKGIAGLRGVVLRQHSRKEELIAPTWGRLAYYTDVDRQFGPVVFLSAQKIPLELDWSKRLGPDGKAELERLIECASESSFDGRSHRLRFDLEAVRKVQLYYTLPHEVGHWADMYEKVELPGLDADLTAWQKLWDSYFLRPGHEREEFAHRYSREARTRLRADGIIPFSRKIDLQRLTEEGLRPEDFVPTSSPS